MMHTPIDQYAIYLLFSISDRDIYYPFNYFPNFDK